jgi:hypothetical protein
MKQPLDAGVTAHGSSLGRVSQNHAGQLDAGHADKKMLMYLGGGH